MSDEQKQNDEPKAQQPAAEQPTKKRVDEDWKRKAREEAERLDAQRAAAKDAAPDQSAAPQAPVRLEARFETLVQSFATEALIALGDIENPYTGERQRSLAHAKYAIDMLQLISDKTQGNLTADEKKLIDETLFDLRMRFLRR